MLLTSLRALELLRTPQAKLAKLNTLRDVCKKTLQVDQALNVQNREVMLKAHVVEILLDAITFTVTEQTDAERLKSRLNWD
jgi:hypothetical protein